MKLPCEIVIIDILPIIRKELTLRLVNAHGITKSRVARMFDISGTAVSQYIHGSRGNNLLVENSPQYGALMAEISDSAEALASKKSNVGNELCRLCDVVMRNGLVEFVYESGMWKDRLGKCAECPKTDIC